MEKKNEKKSGQELKLKLLERIQLMSLFPSSESVVKMVIYRDLKKKIILTQKEIVDYKVREVVSAGNTTFSLDAKAADDSKNIQFTEVEILELRALLQDCSDNKKIPENLIDLCIEMQIS